MAQMEINQKNVPNLDELSVRIPTQVLFKVIGTAKKQNITPEEYAAEAIKQRLNHEENYAFLINDAAYEIVW